MPALAHFLRNELPRRGWSIPEFVQRTKAYGPGLSQSNAYQIIRDERDNVETDTFECIAATLNMTPAQLMVAIGKGSADLGPIHRDVLVRLAHMLEITESVDGISDDIARAYLAKALDPDDYAHYIDMVLKARASTARQRRRGDNRRAGTRDNRSPRPAIDGISGPGGGITACQQAIKDLLTHPLSLQAAT